MYCTIKNLRDSANLLLISARMYVGFARQCHTPDTKHLAETLARADNSRGFEIDHILAIDNVADAVFNLKKPSQRLLANQHLLLLDRAREYELWSQCLKMTSRRSPAFTTLDL